jgi:hypothetical protein
MSEIKNEQIVSEKEEKNLVIDFKNIFKKNSYFSTENFFFSLNEILRNKKIEFLEKNLSIGDINNLKKDEIGKRTFLEKFCITSVQHTNFYKEIISNSFNLKFSNIFKNNNNKIFDEIENNEKYEFFDVDYIGLYHLLWKN